MNFIRILTSTAAIICAGIVIHQTISWWRYEKDRRAQLRDVGKQIDLIQLEIVNDIHLTREERERLWELYEIEKDLNARKKRIFT